jgi:hypothetical protein
VIIVSKSQLNLMLDLMLDILNLERRLEQEDSGSHEDYYRCCCEGMGGMHMG